MYTCVIASPKLAKKFHGMKSYIAYQLTPTVCVKLLSPSFDDLDSDVNLEVLELKFQNQRLELVLGSL